MEFVNVWEHNLQLFKTHSVESDVHPGVHRIEMLFSRPNLIRQ